VHNRGVEIDKQEEIGPEVEECLSHRWTAKKAF
jgi:hypothetical protein